MGWGYYALLTTESTRGTNREAYRLLTLFRETGASTWRMPALPRAEKSFRWAERGPRLNTQHETRGRLVLPLTENSTPNVRPRRRDSPERRAPF